MPTYRELDDVLIFPVFVHPDTKQIIIKITTLITVSATTLNVKFYDYHLLGSIVAYEDHSIFEDFYNVDLDYIDGSKTDLETIIFDSKDVPEKFVCLIDPGAVDYGTLYNVRIHQR